MTVRKLRQQGDPCWTTGCREKNAVLLYVFTIAFPASLFGNSIVRTTEPQFQITYPRRNIFFKFSSDFFFLILQAKQGHIYIYSLIEETAFSRTLAPVVGSAAHLLLCHLHMHSRTNLQLMLKTMVSNFDGVHSPTPKAKEQSGVIEA